MVNPLDIPKNLIGTGFRITSSVVSTAVKPAGAIAGRVLGSGHDSHGEAPTAPPAAGFADATPSAAGEPERTPAELAATGEGRQPAPFGSHEPN
jgi:hypothetical protein